jgi:hypothetical protein
MKFRSTVLLRTFFLWTLFLDLTKLLYCRRSTGLEFENDANRFLPYIMAAEARALESSELLVGEWEVAVRVRGRLSPAQSKASATHCSGINALFPPRQSIVQGRGSGPTVAAPADRIGARKRRYSCRLAVFANQTFVLRPEEEEEEDSESKRSSTVQEPGTGRRRLLPVRGQWSVLSNPYCVTDRFYDNLRLVSYPRVQTKQRVLVPTSTIKDGGNSETSTLVVSSDPVQRVRLEFHGHLRGHYTAGGWVRRIVGPDRYHRGRIRNGVVLVSDADDDDREGCDSSSRGRQQRRSWYPWPLGRRQNVVIATFTARRRMLPFRQLIQELDDDHLRGFELYGNR